MSLVSSPEVRAALTALDAQIEAARQEQHVPGLAVVIVADQDVLFLKGYGFADLANTIPTTPHTVYRIGSNTKLFTATMLMHLRDAGKLQLDEPVERYLPSFTIPSRFPDSSPITFRQLATHTSGLPLEAPLEYGYHFTPTFPSIEALLSSLTYLERCQPAYTAYRYSNLGFTILGHALAQIAHQPYAEYVTQHILQPLGMNDSGFRLSPTMQAQLAVGYEAYEEGQERTVAPYQEYGQAAGMLYASVADIAKFLALQFREYPTTAPLILQATTLREMCIPIATTPDPIVAEQWHQGIGWAIGRVANEFKPCHAGGTSGYWTSLGIVPTVKLGVAVFANAPAQPRLIEDMILTLLVPLWKQLQARSERELHHARHKAWKIYEGRYRLARSALGLIPESELDDCYAAFSVAEDQLTAQFMLLPIIAFSCTLQLYTEHAFRIDESPLAYAFGGEFVTFTIDTDGIAATVIWRDFTFQRDGAA